MVPKRTISIKTKKEVYIRWKGKCAFCGIDLPVEEHHMVAIKDDPSLIDDPDNLILVCANHHELTLKKKPNGIPAISFEDVQDLVKSGVAKAQKRGFYFTVPQNFSVNLGNNVCRRCPYVLIINGKPLIEMWPQRAVTYVDEIRYYLYMRFFDESNNFIGGMFANHWASVVNENWKLEILENEITASHAKRQIFIRFVRNSDIHITGKFYFDGIEVIANHNSLILPVRNVFKNNHIENCEVAFLIEGDNNSASLSICGRLTSSSIKN